MPFVSPVKDQFPYFVCSHASIELPPKRPIVSLSLSLRLQNRSPTAPEDLYSLCDLANQSTLATKPIATINEGSYEVKIAKIMGEFVWHIHDKTDDLFYIISGACTVMFRYPGSESSQGLEDVHLEVGEEGNLPRHGWLFPFSIS